MTNGSLEARTAHPILVVGSTGKTGKRVAERLQAAGLPVREGSRAAKPGFDWEDEAGWPAALEGAGAAYVTYYPDLAAPGAVEKIRAFASTALAQGVRRIVLLSGRGEPEAEEAEQVLMASGADWTVLRCSWFFQNFSENYMVEGVLAGELALPVGDVAEPFVDCDDIADAAFAALTEDGHGEKLYELTGPRALTFQQAVGEIAAALGREVRFVRAPLNEYAEVMRGQGAPEELISLIVYLFGTILDGRNTPIADGVRQALGRAPKDFGVYAREAAASCVWGS